MSVNLLRTFNRLMIVRNIASFKTNMKTIGDNFLITSQVTLNKRIVQNRESSSKSGNTMPSTEAETAIDLTKFVTYEQVKDIPNHPEKLLIDVREPNELAETGIIPSSINIPLNQVPEKLSRDFPKDQFLKLYKREKPTFDTEIIFHCKVGIRSQNATDFTKQLGYKITVSENLQISSNDFVNKFNRPKPSLDTEIIFTCRSGKRAGDACETARKLGFKVVKNYKGSWLEWAEKEGLNKA